MVSITLILRKNDFKKYWILLLRICFSKLRIIYIVFPSKVIGIVQLINIILLILLPIKTIFSNSESLESRKNMIRTLFCVVRKVFENLDWEVKASKLFLFLPCCLFFCQSSAAQDQILLATVFTRTKWY